MYKMDLVLNNIQQLICHKTNQNQASLSVYDAETCQQKTNNSFFKDK